MSVEVINVEREELKTVSASDMEVGVLYKLACKQDDGANYPTVYTKSIRGDIVWFEPPQPEIGSFRRIGTYIKDYCPGPFVVAPEGTTVIIKN